MAKAYWDLSLGSGQIWSEDIHLNIVLAEVFSACALNF